MVLLSVLRRVTATELNGKTVSLLWQCRHCPRNGRQAKGDLRATVLRHGKAFAPDARRYSLVSPYTGR